LKLTKSQTRVCRTCDIERQRRWRHARANSAA
jgi:aspartyl/asparaginyl beta-hydroxylase (cupin superfamily)